jgi:hypothetical protein
MLSTATRCTGCSTRSRCVQRGKGMACGRGVCRIEAVDAPAWLGVVRGVPCRVRACMARVVFRPLQLTLCFWCWCWCWCCGVPVLLRLAAAMRLAACGLLLRCVCAQAWASCGDQSHELFAERAPVAQFLLTASKTPSGLLQ